MYGYIYETTNLVNGKKYIGKHKCNQFDSKYLGSGIALNRAISKYGKENFQIKLLESVNTEDELNNLEKDYIRNRNAVISDKYYNIAHGGDGGDTFTNTGRIIKGHKHSQKWKDNISIGNKGKRLGIMESEDIRNKKRLSHIGLIRVTRNNKGTWISEDELEHYLSLGYERKGISVNSGDSHFMRKRVGMYCWINDGKRDIRIEKSKLTDYIDLGYKKGRIFKPRKKRSTTIESVGSEKYTAK